MPLLERTPPRRRNQAARSDGLASPSPTLLRPTPSPLRSGTRHDTSYTFPSLDALAAPNRERNAALSLATRTTPILSSNSKSRSSVEASGGSKGDSANGRKVVGGQVGRNGPSQSATVGKLHLPLGERNRKAGSSLRSGSKSPLTQGVQDGAPADVRSSSMAPQDQSPANGLYPPLPTSISYDDRLLGGTTAVSQKGANSFEAQMERALASGANPFEDRKRDQMRGEGRALAAAEQGGVLTPKQEWQPLTAGAVARLTGEDVASHSNVNFEPAIVSHTVYPPSLPEVPIGRAPADARLRRELSPDFSALYKERKEKERLQAEIGKQKAKLAEAQSETDRLGKEVEEKEKSNKKHRQRVADLEGLVSQWKSKARETSSTQIAPVAVAWEALRLRCKEGMRKAEEVRERDIEVVISRNEVTYMDARRVEGELDRELIKAEKEKLHKALRVAERQSKQWQRDLDALKSKMERAEKTSLAVEAEQERLKAAFVAEKSKTMTLKGEVEELAERLDEEKASVKRLEQQRMSSSPARPTFASEARKNSPVRRVQDETLKREAAGSQRHSPRKKAGAAGAAKAIKSVSSPMPAAHLSSDPVSPPIETDDALPSPPTVTATKARQKAASGSGAGKRRQYESEEEEEAKEPQVVEKAKKKAGILSRAKKTARKGRGGKAATEEGEEAERGELGEEEDKGWDIQQTPMIPAKKRKGKAPAAVEQVDEGQDSLLNATPFVPNKATGATRGKALTDEEQVDEEQDSTLNATPFVPIKAARATKGRERAERRAEEVTKTPLLPSKRSANTVEEKKGQRGEAGDEAAASTGVAVVEKKKKRRLLKQTSSVANGFLNCNGDAEGDLNPTLNLPMQLSPIKSTDQYGPTIGGARGGGGAGAASRLFGR